MRASKVTDPNEYLITLSEAEAKDLLDLLNALDTSCGCVFGDDSSDKLQSELYRLLNKETP